MAKHRGSRESVGHVGNVGGLNDFSFFLLLLFIKGGGRVTVTNGCGATRFFFYFSLRFLPSAQAVTYSRPGCSRQNNRTGGRRNKKKKAKESVGD